MKKTKVLCAIPCFNEAYNLPSLFADLKREKIDDVADVLFVDDCSSDSTVEVIEQHKYPLLRHQTNQGYGQAVQTGFAYALEHGYEGFIVFPGDHQRSAKDLKHLILLQKISRYDVVSGSKFHIYSQLYGPIRRRIGNRIFSKIAKWGWQSPIEDVLSGFKIYSVQKVAPFFNQLPRSYAFDICFSLYASRFGLRLLETPVDCRYDAHTSKMKSVIWVSAKILFTLFIHFFKKPFFKIHSDQNAISELSSSEIVTPHLKYLQKTVSRDHSKMKQRENDL